MSLGDEGIGQRILKGLGANALGQVILFLYRVLLPPIFLKAWGADLYGEWLLMSSIGVYLSLADLGGRFYIVNLFAQAFSGPDKRRYRELVHTGVLLSFLMPILAFGLFVAVVKFVGPASLLKLTETSESTAVVAIAVLSLQQAITIPQMVVLGIYRASGLLHWGVMISNFTQLCQLLLVAIGLYRGYSLLTVAWLQILPLAAMLVFAAFNIQRRFPELGILSLREARISLVTGFIRPSLHFLFIQIAAVISMQGVISVVGWTLSARDVVAFGTLRSMSNVITQLLGVFTQAVCPDMTHLDTRGDVRKLKALVKVVTRSTVLSSFVLFVVFHFYGGQIYGAWLGGKIGYESVMMDFLLLYMVQMVFWGIYKNLLMAVNRHEALSVIVTVSALLTLVGSYLGARYLGLTGVALGMVLSDLLVPFWLVPWLVSRHYPEFRFWDTMSEFVPAAVALAAVVLIPQSTALVLLGLAFWWLKSVRTGPLGWSA